MFTAIRSTQTWRKEEDDGVIMPVLIHKLFDNKEQRGKSQRFCRLIKEEYFICHIQNYTEYNQQWNVFSAFNPSKRTHTWSSGHTHTHTHTHTPGAVDTHTHTHTHLEQWRHTHTHTHTHTHLEQWTHTHLEQWTHTHTHTWSSGGSSGEQLVPCSRVSPQSWTIPAGAEIRTHNLRLQVQRSIH